MIINIHNYIKDGNNFKFEPYGTPTVRSILNFHSKSTYAQIKYPEENGTFSITMTVRDKIHLSFHPLSNKFNEELKNELFKELNAFCEKYSKFLGYTK
jgi:hypothetical protein